jgi:flagellar hook-associated protein 3 FlgL
MLSLMPTRLLTAGPMDGLARLQAEVTIRQKELSSGVKADLGLDIGGEIRRTVPLRALIDQAATQTRLNGAVAARLGAAQAALGAVADATSNFIGDAIAAGQAPGSRNLLGDAAHDQLKDLARLMRTESGGFPVFAGQNLEASPFIDFTKAEGVAARSAIETAFVTEFGIASNDPAAATLPRTAIESFIAGAFAALFDDAGFAANWSGASQAEMVGEISSGVIGQTASTANNDSVRALAKGFAALAFFQNSAINDDAYVAIADQSLITLGSAREALTAQRANIGQAEEQVKLATERVADSGALAEQTLAAMEQVDPYETATRLNTLITAIESSYAMTARLQRMSLVNFL